MAKDSDDQGDTKVPKDEEPSETDNQTTDDDEEEEEDDDQEAEGSDDGDEEEDEPKLKYARLTSYLGPVYRNGDATSTFLVAGDKMVCLAVTMKAGPILIIYSLLALIMEISYVFPSKPLRLGFADHLQSMSYNYPPFNLYESTTHTLPQYPASRYHRFLRRYPTQSQKA